MKASIIPVVDLSELPEEQCDKVLLSLYYNELYFLFKDRERDPAGLLSLFFQEYDTKRKSFDLFKDWDRYECYRWEVEKEDKKRTARYDTILNKLQTYTNCRYPEKCKFAYALADVMLDYRKMFTDQPEENTEIIETLLTRLQKESNARGVKSIVGLEDRLSKLADARKRVELEYAPYYKIEKPRIAKDVLRKRLILFWKRWENKLNRLSEEDLYDWENRALVDLVRGAYTSMTRQVKCALTAKRKAEYKREALANGIVLPKKRRRRRRRY